MSTLILLRHGRTRWNANEIFTGWLDVGLDDVGVSEARRAAELLTDAGLRPRAAFSSVLTRAVRTTEIVLGCVGRSRSPVHVSWRLNERHYGALQGRSKHAVRVEHGEQRYREWRRSFTGRPPPATGRATQEIRDDPRYVDLHDEDIPRAESLSDVAERLMPYWHGTVAPALGRDHAVLLTAHSNSLRALVKHLDCMDDESIADLDIPTGIPLVYEFDVDLAPRQIGGRYLDAAAAKAGITAVKAEGI